MKRVIGPPQPMPSSSYGGAVIAFEGGDRGGAVSEPETMPAQYSFPRKIGFDEHRRPPAEGTVHGMPGVEGIKTPSKPPGDHGMSDNAGSSGTKMTDGYACSHGCGSMKSKHGLARHVHAKHGGFGGLGHAMQGSKK